MRKPEGVKRSYSAQFTTDWNEVQKLASNSNVTWTHNPLSTAVYLFVLLIFHIFFSVNFDAYLHNNPSPSLSSGEFITLALGQNTASDGNRIWWGDAWNLTAVGHGIVSWMLMHWIKGSANFYDQNELCGLTWFEQVRIKYFSGVLGEALRRMSPASLSPYAHTIHLTPSLLDPPPLTPLQPSSRRPPHTRRPTTPPAS